MSILSPQNKQDTSGKQKKKNARHFHRGRVPDGYYNVKAIHEGLARVQADGSVGRVKPATVVTADAASDRRQQQRLSLVDDGSTVTATSLPRREQQEERAPVAPTISCAVNAQPARNRLSESTRERVSPEDEGILDNRSPTKPKVFDLKGTDRAASSSWLNYYVTCGNHLWVWRG